MQLPSVRKGRKAALCAGAFAEADCGCARTADAILNQLERDLVADEQLVEGAQRRIAAVEEHLAAVDVLDEAVTLARVDADDVAAGRPPGSAVAADWVCRDGWSPWASQTPTYCVTVRRQRDPTGGGRGDRALVAGRADVWAPAERRADVGGPPSGIEPLRIAGESVTMPYVPHHRDRRRISPRARRRRLGVGQP